MPSLPIPFFAALLLAILLHRAWVSIDDRRGNAWFFLLLTACIVHSVVVGLRWGYGLDVVDRIQPVLGACLPPLAWLSFQTLRHGYRGRDAVANLVHFVPVVAIAAIRWTDVMGVDGLLALVYLGYGIALLLQARQGSDALVRTRLERMVPAYSAMLACGIALLVFAVVDLYVAVAIAAGKNDVAAFAIGLVSLAAVVLLGLSAAKGGGSRAPSDSEDAGSHEDAPDVGGSSVPEQAEDSRDNGSPGVATAHPRTERNGGDHAATLARVEGLLRVDRLHHDPDLSLSRLSRRAGIPARQVSAAINALRGMNVSQYINEYRILDACARLEEDDAHITVILLETGFNTKSNFNREFRRVTGMSPSVWREQRRKARQAVARTTPMVGDAASAPYDCCRQQSNPGPVSDAGLEQRATSTPATG